MLFFFKCENEKKFKQKKKKEYEPKSLISTLVEKLPLSRMEKKPHPEEVEAEKSTALPSEKSQSLEEPRQMDDDLSKHMFLECLRFCCKNTKGQVLEARKLMLQLLELIEKTSDKMQELGKLFGEISENQRDLEETERPEIKELKPSLSRIYSDLKISFFSWSQLQVHQSKHLSKLFFPCIEMIQAQNKVIMSVGRLT